MRAAHLCLLLCLPILVSCSTELTRKNDRKLEASASRASELREQLQDGQPKVRSQSHAGIEKVDGIWLPFKRLSEIAAQASARDAARRRITVNRDFRNIQEVAERVTMLTGIPVNVAPDALVAFPGVPQVSTTTTTTTAQSASNPANVPVPPLPPIASAAPPAPVSVQLPPPPVPATVPLSYDGPLSGFLDVAAARFGVSWEWSQNAINMFRYHMSIFTITAQTMSAVMKDLSDTMKSIVQKIS